MRKILYLVRHCQAEGQAPDAALTAGGRTKAEKLADALAERGIERIVSSPFRRAIESIAPLAQRLSLKIETDARLVDDHIGFEMWQRMTTPDVFRVIITDEEAHIERIWQENQ